MDEHEFKFRQMVKEYYTRLSINHIVDEPTWLLQHRNKDKAWGQKDAFAELKQFCADHVLYIKQKELDSITISNAVSPAIWLALHMNYRRWSPYDLGKRAGRDEKWAVDLAADRIQIDEDVSITLAQVLDTHPLFWLHAYKVWEDRRKSER